MSVILLVAMLAVGLAVWMAIAWAVVQRTGNSGWVDTFWSFGVGIAGVTAALAPIDGISPSGRAWIAAALVTFWSLRLGIHIGRRTLKGGDDPRYAQLKREWGDRAPTQLLLFLEIQAAVAFVLAVAILIVAHNPAPLGWLDALGILIALGAIAGEAVADAQLRAFKADPANKGKVCDTGLWSISRHPNYVFETLHWLGYVPLAVSLAYGWGWLTLAAPLMMYALLRHVSGVPPLEAHMLRSRGDAFRDYQRRVPPFWPSPPRS
jgi:steroid 5-alpha reductase family enzyme